MTVPPLPIDIRTIERLLPHRYPFLLVDRVLELDPGQRILALKNVTGNEPFFAGHFPGHPVMPGVLVVEAMAQAGGLLTILSANGDHGHDGRPQQFYLVKIDKARFSKLVVPGDQLRMEVRVLRNIRNMALYACVATVDGTEVASAEVVCAESNAE